MSASIVLADHSLRIKPKTFSAASRENWLVWLRKFKNIASLNRWKAELQCQNLPAYLKGLAEQTCYSLTAEQTSNWEGLERALTDLFRPKESRQVHFSTLFLSPKKSHCLQIWPKQRHKSKNRFRSNFAHRLALARKQTDHS